MSTSNSTRVKPWPSISVCPGLIVFYMNTDLDAAFILSPEQTLSEPPLLLTARLGPKTAMLLGVLWSVR